ncbi:UNVERIFIED_CONTAM: amino acid adenylation domain-containing protein, partial [Ralstonia mannitolilytica]
DDAKTADGIRRNLRANPVTEVKSNNLAYVIYTSGTTGKPKGVMIEHSGVVNLIEQQTSILDLEEILYRSEQKNVVWYADYVFDAHVWEVYSVFALGHILHLLSSEIRTDIKKLHEYIIQHNITIATIPPALLDKESILSLGKIIVAGDITNPEIMECYRKYGIDVINAYGPTETTVCVTFHHYCEDGNPINIGRPIGNTSAYVLDSYLRPVPMGAVGELYIGGVGLSRGYLNRPDLTAVRFLSNPFQSEEEKTSGYNGRIYKTGDLVRILPGGDLEYLGRNDSQIKIRGYRIEPGEIEAAIIGLSGIRKAVVICKESSLGIKYLAAYYVSEHPFESGDISLLLSEVLPDYMVPSAYVHLNELPVTINGKLDRRLLPEPLFIGETEYVAPRTQIEEQLVWIYAEILGIDPDHISIHDDFFRLGGNSIMAVKLIAKIRQDLDMQIKVSVVFGNKSIAELADQLESSSENEASHIDRVCVESAKDQFLSFSQEGLWFLDQFKGGNNAYSIPLVYRIDESINISVLTASLIKLIQRHEVLRSLFLTNTEGTGYQKVIEPFLEFAVQEVSDLKKLETELYKESKKIFCLSEEIPISVSIFLVNNTYYLSTVFHHIAFDGLSVEIFLREFYTIYQSLISGQQCELPILKFQYKDYALWQRNYLKNTILEKQLEYWVHYLRDFETLNLPLDFKRPSEISYEGGCVPFVIPVEVSLNLRSLAKKLGVSLYSVMLSGYYLMLSSYSGQDDIVVGTPFANRHYEGLENLIGLFVNTLVLREKIDFNTNMKSFIESVAVSVSEAQINQDLPFEKIVNALNIKYDSSRHPIFQVMFGFESFSHLSADIFKGNSFLHPFKGSVSDDTAKFDITTMIDDTAETLSGTFNYSSALYAESTIQKMKSSYLYLLEQISALFLCGGSDVKISDLTLLGTEDYNWLTKINGTYSVYNRWATIHGLFEKQVLRTPHHTALVYDGIRLTYCELNDRSNRLAHYLLEKYNIKPDELIPLCLKRSEQMVIGILAVLKTGGAYVPLDPDFPSERRKRILPDTGARLIITETASLDKLGYELSDVICLDDEKVIKDLSRSRTDNPETEVKSNNLAYVIYTSGTTGKPKGVMIEHTSVINLIEEIRGVYGFYETGKFTAYTSYLFDVSVSEFFSALLYGNELHLLNENTKKDIGLVKEYLLSHDITHAYLPPVMLSLLPQCDFPFLDSLMYAGEPCDEETIKYWSRYKNVYNLYGPTESTIYATFRKIQSDKSSPLNIGKPIGNTSVYVLDSCFRPVPIGAVGELYIGGVGVSRGYLNLPELTAERFLPNPFQSEQEKASG